MKYQFLFFYLPDLNPLFSAVYSVYSIILPVDYLLFGCYLRFIGHVYSMQWKLSHKLVPATREMVGCYAVYFL